MFFHSLLGYLVVMGGLSPVIRVLVLGHSVAQGQSLTQSRSLSLRMLSWSVGLNLTSLILTLLFWELQYNHIIIVVTVQDFSISVWTTHPSVVHLPVFCLWIVVLQTHGTLSSVQSFSSRDVQLVILLYPFGLQGNNDVIL